MNARRLSTEAQIASDVRGWMKDAFRMRRELIARGLKPSQVRVELVLRVEPDPNVVRIARTPTPLPPHPQAPAAKR